MVRFCRTCHLPFPAGELQNLKVQDLLKWIGFQTSVEDVQSMVRRQPSLLHCYMLGVVWVAWVSGIDMDSITDSYIYIYVIYIYIYYILCIYIYVFIWFQMLLYLHFCFYIYRKTWCTGWWPMVTDGARRVDFNHNKTMDIHEFLRLMLLVWLILRWERDFPLILRILYGNSDQYWCENICRIYCVYIYIDRDARIVW